MANLTKRAVDTAKPREKRFIVWDNALKGFGLLVLPSGVKSFVVQYRNTHGRSRRQTIGRYGTFTPDQARSDARDILIAVGQGKDPLSVKQEMRAAPSVDELLDQYLSEHVDKHNSASTRTEVGRLVEKQIRPRVGSLKVAAVTRADVAKVHQAMASTPRQANFVLSVVSKAFNLAELWGMRPEYSNPVRGVKRYPENERERFLSEEELSRLGTALREAEKEGLPWIIKEPVSKHLPRDVATRRSAVNREALAAIHLLLFTGARRSEILSLEWNHVDMDAGTITLPARKGGGRKAHPVSEGALSVIAGIPKVSGSKWVLPRGSDPDRHVSVEVVESTWRRLRRHAGLDDVRLHDLRHTVGTFAAQAGGNAFLISHLLRHRNVAITNRYVSPDADPIRAVSEEVSKRIEAGLNGIGDGDVVEMDRYRRSK
ncbi:MAG: site-specific integrase [Hyphomicrobiales bacterium]|nr:site-specific integrase [Hyphomicrobiales bacterium]